MSTDTIEIVPNEQARLLDELQSQLEKQIELVRKGDFLGSEALTEQSDSLVEELVRTKAFEQSEFDDRRRRLAKLYRKLILMVAAEQDHLGKQLQQISQGRKTLRAYRGRG
jgi:hypothetical protein